MDRGLCRRRNCAELLHQRQLIGKAFRVPVANEFGSRDIGFTAHETPEGQSGAIQFADDGGKAVPDADVVDQDADVVVGVARGVEEAEREAPEGELVADPSLAVGAIPPLSATFRSTADSNVMLPLGGLLITFFAGWVMCRISTADELSGSGSVYQIWRLLIRYVAPIGILFVFLKAVGILPELS